MENEEEEWPKELGETRYLYYFMTGCGSGGIYEESEIFEEASTVILLLTVPIPR
jgi:hypothetical protein